MSGRYVLGKRQEHVTRKLVERQPEDIEHHKEDLSTAKEVNDHAWKGLANENLDDSHPHRVNFKQTIEYHEQDLRIAREAGDRAGEGRAYRNLGRAHHSFGNFQRATEYHKKHLSIVKDMGYRAGEGCAHSDLGNAYRNLGDFKQAIEYHKRHLSIAKEEGDKTGEGTAYCNLGNAYHSLGDYKQAEAYYKQHLSIAKEVGDKTGEGNACCNLGITYHSFGDFIQADTYHRHHLSIAKELGDRIAEGDAYCNLGIVHNSLADFEQAITYHKQHLLIAKEMEDRTGEGRAYGNLGNTLCNLGNFKQAIECHKQQLNFAKIVGDRVGEGRACYSLGNGFESLGSLNEAKHYYQSTVKLYNVTRTLLQSEDEWKICFRDLHHDAYTALLRILLKLQETEEALFIAEQGRAQALTDLMKLQYGFTILPSDLFEPQTIISSIRRNTDNITVFLALHENTINFWILCKESQIHYRQKVIDNVCTHSDAATFLENLMKNAFSENSISVRVKCEDRSLDKLRGELSAIKETSQVLEESAQCPNNSLSALYSTIIEAIADLLQGDEIIIVPDGPLCLAPYVAFLDGEARYLTESKRIRIFPSLTSLKLIVDSPKDYHSQHGALLVGDPCVEDIPYLMQLPYARHEVEMIGEILKTQPLTGRNATKDEVLKRITSVALVHIAAHGRMETGEIALAPNPGWTSTNPKDEDFILTMADVQAVKLRARLVVLSCCHSGRGRVTAEGVVGIARAFLGAGARSVMVSLWAIDDEVTFEFMRSFYQHLAKRKSASVALNQAMKFLRESDQFGAVKHWAPFVLIGDDITLELDRKE